MKQAEELENQLIVAVQDGPVPKELLLKIFCMFHMFPPKTWRLISTVHTSWAKCSAKMVWKYYNTRQPDASEPCTTFLGDILSRARKPKFSFADFDMGRISYFYMVNNFQVREFNSLADYTRRKSDMFSKDNVQDETKNQLRAAYVKRQNRGHAQRIAFLSNKFVMQVFNNALEKQMLKKDPLNQYDHRLLAHVLWAFQKLESWLELLIIFDKCNKFISNYDKTKIWRDLSMKCRMLRGHGLVALSYSKTCSDAVGDFFKFASESRVNYSFLTYDIPLFSNRLTLKDMQAYLPYLEIAILKKLITDLKKPKMIALLSSGTLESDTSLITMLNENLDNDFLMQLKDIPSLAQRLTHPLFLERFVSSPLMSESKKSNLAKNLFTGTAIKQYRSLIQARNLLEKAEHPNHQQVLEENSLPNLILSLPATASNSSEFNPRLQTALNMPKDSANLPLGEGYAPLYFNVPSVSDQGAGPMNRVSHQNHS